MMTDVVLIESDTFRLELRKEALERLDIQRTRRIIGLVEDPAALNTMGGWVQDGKKELAKEVGALDPKIMPRKGESDSSRQTRRTRLIKRMNNRFDYLVKVEAALDKRRKELELDGRGD